MKKYDNYKDSGIEWIGEIPEHWGKSRIKYTCKIIGRIGFRGYTVADIVSKGNGAIALSPSNIKNQKLNFYDNTYVSWEKFEESPEIKIIENDVIVVKTGSTIGKIALIGKTDEAMTLNPQLVVFKNIKIDNRLLYYITTSSFFQKYFVINSAGGSTPAISQEKINNFELVCPNSILEQTAIANYLDQKTTQIDILISKKQQFITLLQEERIAVINQAVTKGLDPKVKMKDSGIEWLGEIPEHWEVTRLGFLSSKIGDGLHGTPNYVDISEFKFINGNNIGDGQISIYEHTKCVSEEEYFSNKKELNKNSILMSINGTIGNLGFYKGEKVMLGKSVAYINIIDSNALNFTYKYLESESCKTYIDNQLSGSTIKNLSLYSINKIPIPFPSFDEQKKIVDYITIKTNEINILITKTQQEIELLKEYKTALISEVVTGKVDVRDVVLN
jgi:type I restriction enzyme S subunit